MNINELKSELEKIKDEKYHLLKLINHDIRSPFNRVFALLQLFEMETFEVSAIQKEYLDSMYLTVLSGLEMLTNLRDKREIDAGNIALEPAKFDLAETINRSIRTFSKQMELKKLNVEFKCDVEDPVLNSDEYYVQRIIENVISNAVKFSASEKQIVVLLKEQTSDIQVEIRDHAAGILPQEQQLLFEEFRKLSNSPTGGEGGLGLGLSNARYFAQHLNGSIQLQDSGATGSTFAIRFPK